MAFEKFIEDTKKLADVKITGFVIKISDSAFERIFSPNSIDQVNLFWDGESNRIGFAPTTAEDRSKFVVKQAKIGWSIGARKFFQRYQLGGAVAHGDLKDDHGVIAFSVTLPASASRPGSESPAPRKRRARTKKEHVGE